MQILRLLSNTPLQINIDLIRIDNQLSKNTPQSHMDAFYKVFSEVKNKKYDGLVITGAPLGFMAYEDVNIGQICRRSWTGQRSMSSRRYIYAGQRMLRCIIFMGKCANYVKINCLVYLRTQVLAPKNELMRGFDPVFNAPHSRFGNVPQSAYQRIPELEVLAASDKTGTYIAATKDKRHVFITGHPEYDALTLAEEYARDQLTGQDTPLPEKLFC